MKLKIPYPGILFAFVGLGIFLASALSLAASKTAKIEDGKKVTLSYKLFVEGKLLEVSDAENPFHYTHGENQIIPGLERELTGLQVGDQRTIRVTPGDAYGAVSEEAFQEIAKEKLPSDVPHREGALLEARNDEGQAVLVKISEVREDTVLLDFNHPLAGKELEFQVEVLKIV